MQGCVKKINLNKNDAYWNNFVAEDFKDMSLKDHMGRVEGNIKADILKDDSP